MENKAHSLKIKSKKFQTSPTVGGSRGPISPLSVQIQKHLHYRRFLPAAITAHLPDLHVSLIMVCVYSLEDQAPTEMAGCVIKSLTLGAPKNVSAYK